jgi:Domain of unknown function (DUF4450)
MHEGFWTRRRFLATATAAGASSSLVPAWRQALGQALPPPRSQASSPEITSGSVIPLFESNVACPLRYSVMDGAFAIHNGTEFFNRPLYGPNIPFRVDGGDLPEFSLYLPGHGGNLRLGIAGAEGAERWLFQASSVIMRYAAGRLLYEVRDELLGHEAVLRVEALTIGAGLWLEVSGEHLTPGIALTWAFAGVSGRKGKRNGDIGCEVEPVSRFFQVRPEECRDNSWSVHNTEAEVVARKIRIQLQAPEASEMRIGDGTLWNHGWSVLWASSAETTKPEFPLVAGRVALDGSAVRLRLNVLEGATQPSLPSQSPEDFAHRRADLAHTAGAVTWSTPDPWLDGMASALNIAADAIWDEALGCVMHGAVAWRMPLAGWRGPYVLDVTGRHDRMQRHLRRWIARQNVSAITNGSGGLPTPQGFIEIAPATGTPNAGSAGTRTENLLHSNGDLSHNHYDMNLVFFDALLRHLRWTGDAAFAREAWPALVRHAAWERRLFRRNFGSAKDPLPLYEAYAAIWASDNLQYNGGGATHSSAYNVFLNLGMASVAEMIGEDPAAYRAEAHAISTAMRKLLWIPERGAFAESKNWLGEQTLSESPAMWTLYHAIDSEVTTPKEAWQMAAERLRAVRKVPVTGPDVPEGGWQIACSDWMPYEWSLTLLALGENLHTALALFQAGMSEQGYGLLRGCLIDAGYRGLCPGNFPMSLQLDPHRQESQRDFGDPIGCASRTIVEGLWGILPDLSSSRLKLRPQLPPEWNHASLHHLELDLAYAREGFAETWTITPQFAKPIALTLHLQARTMELPIVHVNGHPATAMFDADAVGSPQLILGPLDAAKSWKVELQWHGKPHIPAPAHPLVCKLGEPISWPQAIPHTELDDPQSCLRNGKAHRLGGHTFFTRVEHGACRYWLPLEINVLSNTALNRSMAPKAGEHFETVDLQNILHGQVRDILNRGYTAPKSGLCSLNLPDELLGGWANFDKKTTLNDAGLRAAGGKLPILNGLVFSTPQNANSPNCCFLSQWQGDQSTVRVKLTGRAKAIYLLFTCTTFPQATHSRHGKLQVHYADGGPATELVLSSPENWWPVEQDFLVDDYIFRLEPVGAPEPPLPIRVDLQTGAVRELDRAALKGHGKTIEGGSANVLRIELDEHRDLSELELKCELFGIVLGLLAITLAR